VLANKESDGSIYQVAVTHPSSKAILDLSLGGKYFKLQSSGRGGGLSRTLVTIVFDHKKQEEPEIPVSV
jgi:hypothetical protein